MGESQGLACRIADAVWRVAYDEDVLEALASVGLTGPDASNRAYDLVEAEYRNTSVDDPNYYRYSSTLFMLATTLPRCKTPSPVKKKRSLCRCCPEKVPRAPIKISREHVRRRLVF